MLRTQSAGENSSVCAHHVEPAAQLFPAFRTYNGNDDLDLYQRHWTLDWRADMHKRRNLVVVGVRLSGTGLIGRYATP